MSFQVELEVLAIGDANFKRRSKDGAHRLTLNLVLIHMVDVVGWLPCDIANKTDPNNQ